MPSLQDKLLKEESSKKSVVFTYIVVGVISIALMISGIYYNAKQSKLYEEAKNLYQVEQMKQANMTLSNTPQKVVVDSKGNISEAVKKMNQYAESVFSEMMTYQDSKSYMTSRDNLKLKIKDAKFFDEIMPEDTDNTGGSFIDSSGIKMKFDNLSLYQIEKDSYYAIISYIPYKKESTLEYDSKTTRKYIAFEIEGNPKVGIEKINVLDSFQKTSN